MSKISLVFFEWFRIYIQFVLEQILTRSSLYSNIFKSCEIYPIPIKMLATVLWEYGSFRFYSTLPMVWLTCELLVTLLPQIPTGLPKITTWGVMITVQFFCTNLRAERHSSNHGVKVVVCLAKYTLKLLGLGSKDRKNIGVHIKNGNNSNPFKHYNSYFYVFDGLTYIISHKLYNFILS